MLYLPPAADFYVTRVHRLLLTAMPNGHDALMAGHGCDDTPLGRIVGPEIE
jgi:hypothetical protein